MRSTALTTTEVRRSRYSDDAAAGVVSMSNSLSPEARACSLAHIAHSIFPMVFSYSSGGFSGPDVNSSHFYSF